MAKQMFRNSLILHRCCSCYRRLFTPFVLLFLLGNLLALPAPLRAAPVLQADPPKVINPAARSPLTFMAEVQSDGVVVHWQVPEAESSWSYAIYRSTDCSWESAVVVNGPLFASTESISRTVSYSIIDPISTEADAATSANSSALVACNYWLLGADSGGAAQIFDAATLQGVQRIFLPLVTI
jgi:hypothetical protein